MYVYVAGGHARECLGVCDGCSWAPRKAFVNRLHAVHGRAAMSKIYLGYAKEWDFNWSEKIDQLIFRGYVTAMLTALGVEVSEFRCFVNR